MTLVILVRRFYTKSPSRYSKSITTLALLPLLAACSGPRVTAEDVAIAHYQAEAARACYAAQVLPPYEDARDAALIVMARALAPDPCRATNVYDARQAIAAAQNQAAGSIIGNVATAGVAAVGIVAGADVLKTAVKGAGGNIVGDRNITTRAEGQSTATGPDQHRHTTTTHMTTP